MPKPAKIHLWFPGIFEFKGGIQVYSAFLLSALQDLYPDWTHKVFLKHDRRSIPAPNTRFHCAGQFPLPVRTIAFAAQLLTFALWQRPDLIISSHVNYTMVAQIIKRRSGVPYWAVAHGIEVWNLQPALKTALQHADRILAVSRYTRDRLIQQGLDPDRIALLPNTFDANRFQIAPKPRHLLQRYNLAPDQPVILTVARLADADRLKGYDSVIRALPQIRQHLPDVCYLLVGKGDDRPRAEQLISDLGLDGLRPGFAHRQVILAGFVPDAELNDYYNLCDVFAMPSQNEGFGIVFLEALACGKPVLAGNQDGARDPLQDGKLGVMVDPHDIESIAQTLVQILQRTYPHPLLYQPEALRQSAIEAFGFDRFRQTLAGLF